MSSENSGKHFATSSSQGGEILEINNDDEVLNNLGYEQHMKRGFNFWSMTAFCLTGLGLLPSLGGTLWFSLGYLGLMPMTWGWLVASFFIMFEVLSLAEMSSAMPTSGGLYFGLKQRFWLTSGLAHLAEETEDAANVVPRAMWVSCLTVAVLGYIFNVVLAFAATDIDAIFESPLGQPLGAILVLAMGNGSLTKLLWICTVLSNFGVVFVCNAAATRIYFAYARDGALPFAKWLSHVNRTTRTPVNATIALSTVFALIGLISLGSTTALQAFFSGSSISGAIAYLMPVLMRCINENNPDYKPGPFNLGKWSRPVRLVACIWTIFTLPLFSFPDSPNPDATTFNWSIAFNGGLFLVVLPWYFFKARKTFHGPGAKDFSQ
ncbi:choline transport protein [Seiridium cupressi]